MIILGISCFFHDSSAVIIKDGKIIAACEEERFTRIKHDTAFPYNAINFCLKTVQIRAEEVDTIAFYEKPLRKFERVLASHVSSFPKSLRTFYLSMPSWIKEKLRIDSILSNLKLNCETFFIPHHLCHAASSFFISPFQNAAIVTLDGVGEWTTTSWGIGNKNLINLTHELQFPHSLGLFYSTVTALLGFSVNNSEYKVMGLSAFGNRDRKSNNQYRKMRKLIDLKKDGSFALNMDYFVYHYQDKMPSEKFISEFVPIRIKDGEITQIHKDIAAAIQLITEDVYLQIIRYVEKETGMKNLCLAGGVALNSVANGQIISKTPFKNVYIQPAAGDGGTSLGAALFAYHGIKKYPRKYIQKHSFFGPDFSNKEIEYFLKKNSIKFEKYSSKKLLLNRVANLIWKNNVIGWFQGKMEWGPRALGARSILANPSNQKMKEILNLKVKHREIFRPFAPSVCIEDANKYFMMDKPIQLPTDFMLMVYPVRNNYKKKLSAVTHVDGTARPQTVRRSTNPLFYDLIRTFEKFSAVPILINTSFNIRGEPIVCTPYDAYRCMMGTEIDYLVMDNYLIARYDNLNHAWNSEIIAND